MAIGPPNGGGGGGGGALALALLVDAVETSGQNRWRSIESSAPAEAPAASARVATRTTAAREQLGAHAKGARTPSGSNSAASIVSSNAPLVARLGAAHLE